MDRAEESPTAEIIAGTPPGGGQDRAARAIASVLPGQTIVTNVAGRGGGNGWDLLASRPGDPHVLAVSSPTLITNRLRGETRLGHRDLTPVALLYIEHSVVVTLPSSRWARPDSFLRELAGTSLVVSFATARGNMNHLALAEISRLVGGEVASVPLRVFDSARRAIADVVEKKGDVAIVSAASAIPELTDGRLVGVAITAPDRLGGVLAAVPTFSELGVPCEIGTWRGMVGPPDLSRAAVESWEARLRAAVETDAWRRMLEARHQTPRYLGPAATAEFLDHQMRELARLLAGAALEVGSG